MKSKVEIKSWKKSRCSSGKFLLARFQFLVCHPNFRSHHSFGLNNLQFNWYKAVYYFSSASHTQKSWPLRTCATPFTPCYRTTTRFDILYYIQHSHTQSFRLSVCKHKFCVSGTFLSHHICKLSKSSSFCFGLTRVFVASPCPVRFNWRFHQF